MTEPELVTHHGGCHCGRVRFAVQAPADLLLHECNCSICQRVGYLHLTVERSALQLLSGEDDLTTYTFNTGVAQHTFCSHCGVKPFYTPRSHPDGYSVNGRCIDPETVRSREIVPFDGENWEAHLHELPKLGERG